MKKNKSILFVGIMISILFILCACLLLLNKYCREESAKQKTCAFYYSKEEQIKDGLSLEIKNTKQWNDPDYHPNHPLGYEFDGVLKNISKHDFKDWSVVLSFTTPVNIDSSWNGKYEVDGSNVNYVATLDTELVKAGETKTFGMVLYGQKNVDLLKVELRGYQHYSLFQMPFLYIIIALLMIWVIIMTVYILLYIRMKRYRRRHELDRKIIKQTMNTLVGFIDAKDNYTKGHSTRVAEYSKEIAKLMKLNPDQITQIYYIALMHDCGKIAVPDAVLKKTSKLTNEEYQIIQSHTTMGDKLLDDFTAIPGIRDGAHYHHERFDGNGYPMHLKAENIPLCARIICVADSFDAMSSNRCYRKKLDMDKILIELNNNSGTQFDPKIIPYMLELIKDGIVAEIQRKYPISS